MYKNNAAELVKNNFIKLNLVGAGNNTKAYGAKIKFSLLDRQSSIPGIVSCKRIPVHSIAGSVFRNSTLAKTLKPLLLPDLTDGKL